MSHGRVKADMMKNIGGDALAMANITKDDSNVITCVHDSQLPGASMASQGPSIEKFIDKSTRGL